MVAGRALAAGAGDRLALRDQTYAAAQQLISAFEGRFGSLRCGDMVGCDFHTAEGRKFFNDNGILKSVCEPAVCLVIAEVAGRRE